MIILYTTDIFLIESKYNQLASLVKHFKPDYTILNGNILCPNNYDSRKTTGIENIFDIFDYMSKLSKVIVQFGKFDTKALSEMFTEKFQNNSNIINITNSIYYDVINFVGVSGNVTNQCNPDWRMYDGYNDDPSKTIGGMIQALTMQSDVEKTVYILTEPPIGLNLDLSDNPVNHGSYDVRRFVEGHLLQPPRLVLSSGFPNNFSVLPIYSVCSRNGCVCIQPSQPLDDFYYCIINIDHLLNVTDIWHPKKYISEEYQNG